MTPLDGHAAAARSDVQLRVYHSVPIRAAILGVLFLNSMVGLILHYAFDLPLSITVIVGDFCLVAFALFMHIDITHSLVRPWCPYCHRRDDGDDDDEAPPPGPEDHGADCEHKTKVG